MGVATAYTAAPVGCGTPPCATAHTPASEATKRKPMANSRRRQYTRGPRRPAGRYSAFQPMPLPPSLARMLCVAVGRGLA